jgi:hypothetical protein
MIVCSQCRSCTPGKTGCYHKELDSSMEATIIWDTSMMENWVWGCLKIYPSQSHTQRLAEKLHSWIRSYLQTHRSMLHWLKSFTQLCWNYKQHTFSKSSESVILMQMEKNHAEFWDGKIKFRTRQATAFHIMTPHLCSNYTTLYSFCQHKKTMTQIVSFLQIIHQRATPTCNCRNFRKELGLWVCFASLAMTCSLLFIAMSAVKSQSPSKPRVFPETCVSFHSSSCAKAWQKLSCSQPYRPICKTISD